MSEAARAFGPVADEYERGRPAYPREAVAWLAEKLGIGPSKQVLDLAAGTGKLTRDLVATGVAVVAVEPIEGMRRKLVEALPSVRVLDGTAEEIPLADASVDAVTVAQAFHWFRGSEALAEIHRVLRPGGRLGLLWNIRDERADWVARLGEILERHRGDAPRYVSGAWREAFATTTLFAPPEERRFSFVQELDDQGLLARVASISFVASLPSPARERVLADVRRLVRTHPQTSGKASFALPYRTEVFWCARRSP